MGGLENVNDVTLHNVKSNKGWNKLSRDLNGGGREVLLAAGSRGMTFDLETEKKRQPNYSVRQRYIQARCLKGLGHEIDLKKFIKNGQIWA